MLWGNDAEPAVACLQSCTREGVLDERFKMFTYDVEFLNGRAAMVGLASTILIECVTHKALFGFFH